MRCFSRAVIGAALMAVGLGACGGVTPTRILSGEDKRHLLAARAKALERSKTGQGTNWSNSKTGNRGTVVPTRTYKSGDGADCREFQQTTTIAGETDLAYGASCRAPDGSWKLTVEPSRYRPREYSRGHFGYGYGHSGYYGYPHFRYGHRYYGW